LNIEREQVLLLRHTVTELRRTYETVFGEACRSNHKTWLVKRILWRMQANAEGDLSARARQRASELANDADLRVKAPRASVPLAPPSARMTPASPPVTHDKRLPLPGTVLTRLYKGETLQVTVRDNGLEWQGEIYRSLSAVAKAITGSHCNGFLFFKLTETAQ